MKLRVGARTDVGRVRKGNEDSYTVEDPLFAVADGMGGHQGGEVASSMALETIGKGDGTLEELARQANEAVYRKAAGDPGLAGMGTTLTALRTDGDFLRMVHVGDSRAYRLRDGRLQRLTKDHTLVERLVDEGKLTVEEAEMHPQRSVLTRALGVDEALQVDQGAIEPHAGDRLLLCSDGLTSMVSEERIAGILADTADPQAAADALVAAANEAGGQDNITAVILDVVEVKGETSPKTGETEGAPQAAGTELARPAAATRGQGRNRRILMWLAVVVVVVGAGLWAAKALWVDHQFYVGDSNGNVAVYRGIPAAPLGLELSTPVREFPELPASEVSRFPEYRNLSSGITAMSEQDALAIVAEMRAALAQEMSEGADQVTAMRCLGCGQSAGLYPEVLAS